jgi:hypothetical protein
VVSPVRFRPSPCAPLRRALPRLHQAVEQRLDELVLEQHRVRAGLVDGPVQLGSVVAPIRFRPSPLSIELSNRHFDDFE